MSEPEDFDALLKPLDEREQLKRHKNGDLNLTAGTIKRLLTEFEPLRHVFRFDAFRAEHCLMSEIPGQETRSAEPFPRPMQDHDVVALGLYLERLSNRRAPATKVLAEVIDVMAREQQFHSLQESLKLLPEHDGIARLDRWLTTYLGVKETPYSCLVGAMFLVQVIARARQPGCKADYVMVLEGPQGVGKSQVVNILAGRFAGDDLPAIVANSKEHKEYLIGRWLIELAELDGLTSQKNQRAAKSFFTTSVDTHRLPYAKRASSHPRTCVFIGTTNETKPYLTDDSGNRRYWPVRVGRIELEELRQDRDQLLAEALVAYNAGAKSYPTAEVEAHYFKFEQAKRGYLDPLKVRLEEVLLRKRETTVHDCLDLLNLPSNRGNEMRVGRLLVSMNWTRKNIRRQGEQKWVYIRTA